MKWQLEEMVEDAIVSYLKANVNDELAVFAAWGFDGDDFVLPCAVVYAGSSEPISEPAEWHDPRMLSVQVAVMTESSPLTDDEGNELKTARERNIEARSKVMDLLFVSDLVTPLIARLIPDVAFSMAQATTTERSTEDKRLITIINLEVIAEPVTGS